MSEPLSSIAIVGSGLVGLSAALGFARALPHAAVTLVTLPPHSAALADRFPVILPSTRFVLDMLGVGETELLRAGGATHRLAERFAGWRVDGAAWLHGSGETGVPIGAAAFHHGWLEARRAGAAAMFHDYSPAAALAQSGRFLRPSADERSLLSRADYALRLDPIATGRLFAAKAQAARVEIVPGPVASVSRRPDGDIAAVHLADGRALAADLFVDCSGSAQMLGAADAWIDWSGALPVDRLLLAASAGAPSPLDDYQATETGWRAAWPLGDRTLIGFAYASALTPEPRARRMLGGAGAVAEAIEIRAGRRRTPWRGNVLALGDAAVACGPLGWAGVAVAHADLALALELLPSRDLPPLLLAEYNRRAGLRADRVRDFLSLHYIAANRRAGPFWRKIAETEAPADVAFALATFARHGHLPRHDEALFDKASWIAVLLGLGLTPAYPHPTTAGSDPATTGDALARLQAAVAALPASAPPYPDYLARLAAA